MPQYHTLRAVRPSRLGYSLHTRIVPRRYYSSGSPNTSVHPDNWFNRTGEKEASDPTQIHMRSDEYSKSGGDDIVAEQVVASFKSFVTNDPEYEKTLAGIGNVINPLELSPASPELSRILNEEIVQKNEERNPLDRTGPGVTRKSKRVERTEIDFRMKPYWHTK